MKQEDKDLLLNDLCGRLPYGVKYECSDIKNIWKLNAILTKRHDDGVFLDIYNPLDLCKPYLFPLSSMTEEQKEELENLGWYFDNFEINNVNECIGTYREYVAHLDCFVLIDWLNKNHFDYRGLIEKSLAIDATNLGIY